MIVQVQRALVYFLTYLKERLCLLHCLFISLLFYITRCDWVFQFVRSFNLGFLRSFFSLALSLLSFLSIFWSYWYAEVIWNYQSTFPDLLCSMLSCCDNTKVCILTVCYTRVYRVHICVHMCNTRYLSNLLLWLLIIKYCCPFESCWLFVCLCVFPNLFKYSSTYTGKHWSQWRYRYKTFLFYLPAILSVYALHIILNWFKKNQCTEKKC